MGILHLIKVLEAECPNALVTRKLEEFCGYKIAIDISIYLNKFIKSTGPDGSEWIDNFIEMFCRLKKCGIKLICVFDGPGAPREKRQEQEKRRNDAVKKNKKIDDAKYLLAKIESDYVPYDTPLETNIKEQIRNVVGKNRRRETEDIEDYDDLAGVVMGIKQAIVRYEKQNASILPEHSQILKEIIAAMGFNMFVAEGEAEGLCSWMCRRGIVDAVLTEDTDVLAYGCPMVLFKMNKFHNTALVIRYEDVLSELDLTPECFLDMCIFLKCDYNKYSKILGYPRGRIDKKGKPKKPVAIGTKKVLPWIREHHSLENISEILENPEDLIYERCREIFTLPEEDPKYIRIAYDRKLDVEGLKKILQEHKTRITMDFIRLSWIPTPILFPK